MEEKKIHEEEGKHIVLWLTSDKGELIEITLNDDVFEEIMVRLPVKTLMICQTVSKHWKRKLTSKYFKERYMLHHKTHEPKLIFLCNDPREWEKGIYSIKRMRLDWSSTCLVEEEEEYRIYDKREEQVVSVCGSLDGLFCFSGVWDLKRPIKVINPATRWSKTLPLACTQLEDLDNKKLLTRPGFGKDLVTRTYKLVWLHNIKDKHTLSCEVFDFGVKQWRYVIPPPPDHRIDYKPTFVNGWLYWFSKDKTKLIAVDLHMEIFRVVPNPINKESSCVEMSMRSVDEDRRIVYISETNGDGMQHVWRLTNHNTRGGELSIMDKILSFDLKKIPNCSFLLDVIAISKDGNKMMLSQPFFTLLVCQPLNPTSILYHEFSCSPPRPGNSLVFSYFPSLASPL